MSNSIIRNPLETDDTTYPSGLGLENVQIRNDDVDSIEFLHSTPGKTFHFSPSLTKWSPKIHDVVSISEEIIDSSSEEETRSVEAIVNDHTVFIDEDAVKQEELIDENTEENFESEINDQSPKKVVDELDSSFDVNKVKQEYNIKDNLCIVLDKITTVNQPSISSQNESQTKRIARNKVARRNNSAVITDSPRKSISLPNRSNHQSRKKYCKKNVKENQQLHKPTNNSAKAEKTQTKTQIRSANCSRSKRQSLRLSGKSPEVTPVDELLLSTTRSGKKRVYEDPKSKAISNDKSEYRHIHNGSKVSLKTEPESETGQRPRSPSPSSYRKNIDVMYVCICCKQKYLSLEHVKAHIKTHFS